MSDSEEDEVDPAGNERRRQLPLGNTLAQCGLCLSCGTPFMSTPLNAVDFGDSCMLYLHKEYNLDDTVRESVSNAGKIRLMGNMQRAHLVHDKAHSVAVGYAAYKMPIGDVDIPDHNQVGDDAHPALHAVGGAHLRWDEPVAEGVRFGSNDKVMAAWASPAPQRDEVLDLYTEVMESGDFESEWTPFTFLPIPPTYSSDTQNNIVLLCDICNLAATSLGQFSKILHELVPRNTYDLYAVQGGNLKNPVMSNFGEWRVNSNAGPRVTRNLTAEVAVFLHSCTNLALPPALHLAPEVERIVLQNRVALLTHLNWITLQVVCLAEQAYAPLLNVKLPKHTRIYTGLADLYISLWLWLYSRWRYDDLMNVSFACWHQKYMWVCVDCPALWRDGAGRDRTVSNLLSYVLPQQAGATPARDKVAACVRGLLALYQVVLPVVRILTGHLVDIRVRDFFLPFSEALQLERISAAHCREYSFDSYLRELGVSATCHQLIRNMSQASAKYRQKLYDFFRTVQETEIQNVVRSGYARSNGVGMSKKHAELLYLLCYLDESERTRLLDALQENRPEVRDPARKCFWAAVLELRRVGAIGAA